MVMKEILESIIEECTNRGLKVSVEGKGVYKVDGFSKSGNALLYVDGEEIICETRYGQKDHIITFKDLALVAKQWYEAYRDREPFQEVEPEWRPILSEYYDSTSGRSSSDSDITLEDLEDLPF